MDIPLDFYDVQRQEMVDLLSTLSIKNAENVTVQQVYDKLKNLIETTHLTPKT